MPKRRGTHNANGEDIDMQTGALHRFEVTVPEPGIAWIEFYPGVDRLKR